MAPGGFARNCLAMCRNQGDTLTQRELVDFVKPSPVTVIPDRTYTLTSPMSNTSSKHKNELHDSYERAK